MGYITKYGSFWGMLPQTAGRVFWVADADSYQVEGRTYPASDNNDGLSPERALRTVDYAVGLCTANEGDVIVLLHGSHSVSATVAVDVAGITITGIPGNIPPSTGRMPGAGARRRTSIVSTSGDVFTVTAADVEICHIHFDDLAATQCIDASAAADRLYVHDCSFLLDATADTNTMGIHFSTSTTGSVDHAVISNCYFVAGAANGPAIRALGTVIGLTIENSTFRLVGAAAWADAITVIDAGSVGTLIRDCDFTAPTSATTVITNCIDVTGATVDAATQVYRCYIPAGSDGVTATAMADVVLCETYLANSSGGTIVTNG
jgi:hypothetical protein